MTANNKPRQLLVLHRIHRILHHTQHIKARQNRLRQLNILLERDRRIISPARRICRSNNSTACLERRDDPSFRDGDTLLLHRFMDTRAVRVVHLVELVDQARPFVSEHQCPALERPFARHGVLPHTRGETDGGGTLACGKYGAVRCLLDIFQELGFRCAGVAEQEDVDVTTNRVLAVDVLRLAAEQRERDGRLDVLMSVNRGGDRLDDLSRDTLVLGHLPDIAFVFLGQSECGEEVFFLVDVIRLDDGGKDGETVLYIERGVEIVAIDTGNFLRVPSGVRVSLIYDVVNLKDTHDFLARFCGVDQVPEQDYFAMARQSTCRHRAWRLLQSHLLIVAVHRLQNQSQNCNMIRGSLSTTYLLSIDRKWSPALAIWA